MARFKGFNTIGQHKKFTLTDRDLVIRDLLNALNIREGELPGKPEFGTGIWNYVFEPNLPETERRIVAEMQELIDADPRIVADNINAFSQENGIMIELRVRVLPNVEPETLKLLFNEESNTAEIV
jgi:phage baseplate assembly protein W